MQRTEHKPFTPAEPLRSLPLLLGALFVAVLFTDLLLLAQPGLVRSLRDGWLGAIGSAGIGAPWATLLAAAVSLAAIGLTAALLATFVRGVLQSPYTSLAPVVASLCAFVIAQSPVSLPLPLPSALFAGLCAMLLVAGGALFRGSSIGRNLVGAFLLAIPLLLVCAAYLLIQGTPEAAAHPFDRRAQLLVFMLALASIGIPLIAVVWPRGLAGARSGDAETDSDIGEQVVELLERARTSEARADDAERRLALASSGSVPHLRSDDEFVTQRPKPNAPLWIWAITAIVIGANVWAYYAGYQPLRERLRAQIDANRQLTQKEASTVALLQAKWDEERAALVQQLAAAEAARQTAPQPGSASSAGVPTHSQRQSAPALPAADSPDAAGEPSSAAERAAARKAERKALWAERRAARLAAKAAKAAAAAAAKAEADEPEKPAKPEAPAAPAAAARREPELGVEQSNDDPLEGL